MDKVALVKEMYRDLRGKDTDSVRETLFKSGWKETDFDAVMDNYGFHAFLHTEKDGTKLFFSFNDEGLYQVQTE